MNTTKTKAYAAHSATSPLASATIPRREPTPRYVKIEILFCGICHSDLHYLNLLKVDGNLTLVGAPEKPHAISAFSLIMGRRSLSGSPIGGIAETQEMLDFCSQHNITADIEVIPIQKVNDAYERMAKGDVKYRFSIDMASLKVE
jgi:D-arabinose 1-dehydrogenase-like Zn-dependent alcohol dehydrogenase